MTIRPVFLAVFLTLSACDVGRVAGVDETQGPVRPLNNTTSTGAHSELRITASRGATVESTDQFRRSIERLQRLKATPGASFMGRDVYGKPISVDQAIAIMEAALARRSRGSGDIGTTGHGCTEDGVTGGSLIESYPYTGNCRWIVFTGWTRTWGTADTRVRSDMRIEGMGGDLLWSHWMYGHSFTDFVQREHEVQVCGSAQAVAYIDSEHLGFGWGTYSPQAWSSNSMVI